MKRFAKLLAVLLIVSMFLAFGLTAHADPPDSGMITVEWPDGVDAYYFTYTDDLWRLFDATVGKNENGQVTAETPIAYTYSGTAEQIAIINGGGFFHVDEAGNATALPEAIQVVDGKNFLTSEAAEWLKENIGDIGEKINLVSDSTWRYSYNSNPNKPYYEKLWGDKKTIFHNLPWGYYYLESTVGSLVMVDSTHPHAEIKDKNSQPGLDKSITNVTNSNEEERKEDIRPGTGPSTNTPYDTATAQIGDRVEYTLEVTAKPGAENYYLCDEQSVGLELIPNSVVIKVGEEVLAPANYKLYTAANPNKLTAVGTGQDAETGLYGFQIVKYTDYPENGSTIDTISREESYLSPYDSNLLILFEQDWLDTITADTKIEITYECTVTKEAQVAVEGNPNKVTLVYGRGGRSIDDRASVYSAMIAVYKYEGEGTSHSAPVNRGLNGVKFILQREDGKYLYQDANQAVHWVDSPAEATEFTTGGDGNEKTVRLTPDYWWDNLYPGPDGVEGTADDFAIYENLSYDYNSPPSYAYSRLAFFVGPDGVPYTADDYYLVNLANEKYIITPGPDGKWGNGDELQRPADGYIIINGLTNGTYTLIETQALPGYNLAAPVTVTINNTDNTFATLKAQVDVLNQAGTELPNTGGMGVTLFYLLGGMSLLLGAALLLRKKNAQGV